MTKKIWMITLFAAICVQMAQANQPTTLTASPKYEIRAVWLTTLNGLDWPRNYTDGSAASIDRQKRQLTDILDQLKAVGINTVLLQTRVRATTIYPSEKEPWDACLTGSAGRNPGYDPLQFAIDECHRRGMQLHAWVVTIPVGKWTSTGCAQLRKRYTNLVKKIKDEGFMDPEKPQTATYIADICEEITRRYDIDGIHLDYIRYPETWKIKVTRQQGRRHITSIAETISRRVKSVKPWVMMSCSPLGKHDDLSRYSSRGWNARTTVCQDAQEWLRTGVMDALFPMIYFRDNNFYPFAIDWQEQSHGKIVAPGLATYNLDRREANWPLTTLTQEMNVLRQLGLGHTHFRSRFLTDNTKGIYTFARSFNPYPALIPPMTWLNATPPEAPTELRVVFGNRGARSEERGARNEERGMRNEERGMRSEERGIMLLWKAPSANSTPSNPFTPPSSPFTPPSNPSQPLLYNVYASTICPVDISDARNLVATRLTTNHVTFSNTSQPMFYAVTALDRFGNESEPLQSHQPDLRNATPNTQSSSSNLPILACDGRQLTLPEKPATLDANTLAIETMQGKLVATRPWRGQKTDVSTLPEGFYQLRSLNRKGITHRLGFFQLKRRTDI